MAIPRQTPGHHLPSRRGERRRTDGLCRISGVTEGQITDAGWHGFGIETHASLRIGRTYAVTLEEDGRRVRLQATVRWCSLVRLERRADGDVWPVYRAGLQSEPLTPE